MTKLRKNSSPRSWGVHTQGQENREVQPPGWPGSNLHDTYIVGDVSVSCNPIRFDQAENITQAAGFALSLGYPLEHHLTVRWPDQNGSLNNHYELLRKIGEWQEYNLSKRVFVWSREAKGGHHSHILLHVPRPMKPKLQKLVRKWLKQILGLRSLPVGAVNFTVHRKVGQSFDHMRNRVRYILKGADADTRLLFGCEKSETTYIKGKRAGVSQDLNRKARKLAGGVLPSGARKPTREMLEAASVPDLMETKQKAEYLPADTALAG